MSASQTDHQHRSKTIAETTIAGAGQDLSMLAAVVKAAELIDTLASPGPFTVFAPSDAAFAKLPAGQIDRLFKPENRLKLTSLATYHILAGQLTVAEMRRRVQANDGHLTLRTVEGDTIEVEDRGESLEIVDSRGFHASVTMSDLLRSNGVIHVMDSVLSPPAW
jgi:uncharacterized surface protein with fasciclin (FAS1) repeats